MTEREKIIEEMEFVIRPQACNDDICKLYNDNCAKCEATRLYNAGYRKAKDVFAKCKEKCMFQGYPYGIDYEELVEVFKEFGVEVDE